MKRTGLILLACLLLALRAVAQAPAKAAPDDLVVTAEVIDHKYLPDKKSSGKPSLVLSAKMMIRNTTNRKREITVMRCSWHWAWTSKGAYSICGPSGCDGNSPVPIVIPAGQTAEFYDELCIRESENLTNDSVRIFQFGFVDNTYDDYRASLFEGKLLHEPVIYWSNELRDDVRPIATEEIKQKIRRRQYGLPGEDR